jgi:hypothetical protein
MGVGSDLWDAVDAARSLAFSPTPAGARLIIQSSLHYTRGLCVRGLQHRTPKKTHLREKKGRAWDHVLVKCPCLFLGNGLGFSMRLFGLTF